MKRRRWIAGGPQGLLQRGVAVLAGDWTEGDPEITRFLESRPRGGPLYLWYRQERSRGCHRSSPRRCSFPALGPHPARSALPYFFPAIQVLDHLRSGERLHVNRADVAIDDDEIRPICLVERTNPGLRTRRTRRRE